MESNFFRNNICNTCKDPSKRPLKLCSQCRVVPYCCKDHQSKDWKSHKGICKIIAKEHEFFKFRVETHQQLLTFIQQRGLMWQLKLGRKLTKAETQMFMFPRFCAVCYETNPTINCEDCLSVFYCSAKHQLEHLAQHKKFCTQLWLSLAFDCYFCRNLPTDLFKVKIVAETFQSIEAMFMFDTKLDNIMALLLESNVNYHNSHPDFIFNCDQILSGLTILYALEKTATFVNRRLFKPSIEIHIIGASVFELSLNWPVIIEIFFHWIQNLEQLNITFIGPEIEDNHSALHPNILKQHFCKSCQKQNSRLIGNIISHKCLYHEIVNELEKPDLRVALNSGLHEYHESNADSWKETVKILTDTLDVPLVLTAYTSEEVMNDLKIMGQDEILYGPKENPFSNLRPLLDWTSGGNPLNSPIYFINNFIAILKKPK